MTLLDRSLQLPSSPSHSLFLFGPRQTGKSTLLRKTYPEAIWLDLLKADEHRRYLTNPEALRMERRLADNRMVVIDEIQKVPALLDEVHWLIENRGITFVLCGSSARKLRRGHANLLGGRALHFDLSGLVSEELGTAFDLDLVLNRGYLPNIYFSDHYQHLLRSYVGDYLKEEIAAEGLVRNLPGFSHFLDAASLCDTEPISYSNIARECGIAVNTVREYFQILVDTLVGSFLPVWRKRPKRRLTASPKFYFFDLGVVNLLARRGRIVQKSELFGKAFENWVFHELDSHRRYSNQFYDLAFWRMSTGSEVDFILGDMAVAIEVKGADRIADHHCKGLRELIKDHPEVGRRLLVCLEPHDRQTRDGIEILSYRSFARSLWQGEFSEMLKQ